MNEIKLSEVFDTKEDKNQFMRDAFAYLNKQPSVAANQLLDRVTFKQSVFGLLKEKLKTLNERYLLDAVSWIERESKEIEELRRELMYIKDNCKLKLKNQQEASEQEKKTLIMILIMNTLISQEISLIIRQKRLIV